MQPLSEHRHAARGDERGAIGRALHRQVRQRAARSLRGAVVLIVVVVVLPQYFEQERDAAGLANGVAVRASGGKSVESRRGVLRRHASAPSTQETNEKPDGRCGGLLGRAALDESEQPVAQQLEYLVEVLVGERLSNARYRWSFAHPFGLLMG